MVSCLQTQLLHAFEDPVLTATQPSKLVAAFFTTWHAIKGGALLVKVDCL